MISNVAVLLSLAISCLALNAANFQSFTGMISQGTFLKSGETPLFYYECKTGQCMITYFWFTGAIDRISNTRFKYYIDGEKKPSIDGEYYLMHGIGFDADESPWGNTVTGKGAFGGAVYNTYRIPFSKSVNVTGILPSNNTRTGPFYFITRGIDGSSQVDLGATTLPPQARLKLYTNEQVTLQPLQYLELANSKGSGALFSVFIQARGTAKNYGYLEACMRAYLDNGKTREMLSSGTEDYFQSAYYFNGGGFHFPEAGLTYKKDFDFAAYKFHINDLFVFKDGGMRLVWRNGETGDAKTGLKCSDDHYEMPLPNDGEITTTTYTWVYEW